MVDERFRFEIVKTWDHAEIVSLYEEGGWWKEGSDELGIYDLISGSFCFCVAINTCSNHAVGMGRMISDGVSDGYIQDVIVSEKYRKLGIGSGIIRCIIEFAKTNNVGWIGLIGNPGTKEFYNLLGFTEMKDFVPMLFVGEKK